MVDTTPRVIDSSAGCDCPFDVRATVERLLQSVPTERLRGLSAIVLSCAAELPRKRRRQRLWHRGRKLRGKDAAGLYHPRQGSEPAWIELMLDHTIPPDFPRWYFRWPVGQDMTIGAILYHEIGHHIHATTRPEFKDKEDVADEWMLRLMRNHLRNVHPYWFPVLFLVSKLAVLFDHR